MKDDAMRFFLDRYKKFGHDIDPLKIKLRQSIRINTIKSEENKVVNALAKKGVILEKIPFTQYGYWADAKFSLSSTKEYLDGFFYIQEAASQVPVGILDPKPGDIVLDMCAAPGSKTTQLAQIMENSGTIVALDNKSERIVALKNNLSRCGVKNCIVYNLDGTEITKTGILFDKILLDAPCSGNFVTDKTWFSKRSLDGIKKQVVVQKKLLAAAVSSLKKTGSIVYSTCSLEPEENEQVIEWALDTLPVSLVSTGLKIGESGLSEKTELCKRFWPDKETTQGFFIAKLILKR